MQITHTLTTDSIFDGNGKAVIVEGGGSFFGNNSGTVKNLRLGGEICLAFHNYGLIENCYVGGEMNLGNAVGIVGGIAGRNLGCGIIRNCYSDMTINIKEFSQAIGGICGY